MISFILLGNIYETLSPNAPMSRSALEAGSRKKETQ